MQICIANLFLSESRWHLCKKSQVWFLVFNAPQLPQGASHTSCRQKLRLCNFFRFRKNQTPVPSDYIEREDKIFRIHSFPSSVNPQKRVKTSWDCIWRHPMATRDLQMSRVKLCCWKKEKGLFLWHLFWNIHQLRRPGIYFLYLPCVFVGSLPSIVPC